MRASVLLSGRHRLGAQWLALPLQRGRATPQRRAKAPAAETRL